MLVFQWTETGASRSANTPFGARHLHVNLYTGGEKGGGLWTWSATGMKPRGFFHSIEAAQIAAEAWLLSACRAAVIEAEAMEALSA